MANWIIRTREAVLIMALLCMTVTANDSLACVPAMPATLLGETETQARARRDELTSLTRSMDIDTPRRELESQAALWDSAAQVVLLEPLSIGELEPVARATLDQRRAAAHGQRTHGPRPMPSRKVRIIVRVPQPSIENEISTLIVRAWLKGHGPQKEIEFRTYRNSCGGYSNLGQKIVSPVVLFASPGPISEDSLLGLIAENEIVDPSIAAALVRVRQSLKRSAQ
jgi:hypothetical protein